MDEIASLCRVCMNANPESTLLNINASLSPGQLPICDVLAVICPPVFSESLTSKDSVMPQCICQDCCQRVYSAYDLFQMCVETNQKLMKLLEERDNPDNEEKMKEEVFSDPELTVSQEISSQEIAGRSEEKRSLKNVLNKTCNICHKSLRTTLALEKHILTSHPAQVLRCEACDKVFSSQEQLTEHTIFHETGRAFRCEACDKRFKTASALRDHKRTHSGKAAFLCTVCGKGFNHRSNLRQHATLHTQQKPFGCDQCPARFRANGALKVHMLTHTKEKAYACEECGALFTMKHSLTKHSRIHKGVRPFGCEFCEKRFTSSDHAKRHMRAHTGEKPFQCRLCNRSFTQCNDLVKHCRGHFGADLYPCDRCSQSYRLLTDLRNHYKVHFGTEEDEETAAMKNLEERIAWASATGGSKEVRFTSVSMIERRYEQEQQRKDVEGGGKRDVVAPERVVVIPVGLPDIPAVSAVGLRVESGGSNKEYQVNL